MSLILWTRYFLKAQGYGVDDAIIYQDNKSAWYFFVLDRIKKNEVHVQYCPTHNMLADYFTKLLQGATFHKFRDAIMNHNFVPAEVHPRDHRSVLDPKHVNDQSHTTTLQLKQNQGQKLTESEETKDLTQPQEKDKKHHRNSHF